MYKETNNLTKEQIGRQRNNKESLQTRRGGQIKSGLIQIEKQTIQTQKFTDSETERQIQREREK